MGAPPPLLPPRYPQIWLQTIRFLGAKQKWYLRTFFFLLGQLWWKMKTFYSPPSKSLIRGHEMPWFFVPLTEGQPPPPPIPLEEFSLRHCPWTEGQLNQDEYDYMHVFAIKYYQYTCSFKLYINRSPPVHKAPLFWRKKYEAPICETISKDKTISLIFLRFPWISLDFLKLLDFLENFLKESKFPQISLQISPNLRKCPSGGPDVVSGYTICPPPSLHRLKNPKTTTK